MILTYKYLTQRLKTENGTLMKLVTTIQHDFFPINSTVTKKLLTSQEFGRNCTEEGQKLLLMYLLTKRTEQIICLGLSSCIWKSWVWHNFTNITTPNFRVKVSCMYVFFLVNKSPDWFNYSFSWICKLFSKELQNKNSA